MDQNEKDTNISNNFTIGFIALFATIITIIAILCNNNKHTHDSVNELVKQGTNPLVAACAHGIISDYNDKCVNLQKDTK